MRSLKVGDRVQLRDSSLLMGGVVTEVLMDQYYVKVRWDYAHVATTHSRHSLEPVH